MTTSCIAFENVEIFIKRKLSYTQKKTVEKDVERILIKDQGFCDIKC